MPSKHLLGVLMIHGNERRLCFLLVVYGTLCDRSSSPHNTCTAQFWDLPVTRFKKAVKFDTNGADYSGGAFAVTYGGLYGT